MSDALAELTDAETEIADAEAEIADGERKLIEAQEELEDGWEEYRRGSKEFDLEIAAALEGGMMGYEMFRSGFQFYSGDGLVKKGVENTIDSVSEMVRDGMKGTDDKIIELMTRC